MNLKKFLMAGGLSMVLILGACGSGEEEASEEPATEEDSSASSGDVDTESIARDNCASCHGQDFSGGMGPAIAGMRLSADEFSTLVGYSLGQIPAIREEQIKVNV